MSIAAADALLEELAKLSHYDRVRRMVELGRRLAPSSSDADARSIVDALAAHPNAYARLLALHTVFTSRDGARVLAALSDRSALVRRRARGLVHLFCDDAEAAIAIDRTPPGRARATLCLRLRRARREGVVDTFVANALSAPSPSLGKLADLLPFGSREGQARHREALRESSGLLSWKRAAVWHPEVARADMIEMVASGEALDPRRWWRFLAMLHVLAERSPDAAIEVLGRHLVTSDPRRPAERAVLQTLARKRPAAVFDLLEEVHARTQAEAPPGVFGLVSFTSQTETLGVERILSLIRQGGRPLPEGKRGLRWLHRLPADDRARVARTWLDEGRGSWGAFLLRDVPADDASSQEARDRAFVRWQIASQRQDGSIDLEAIAWLPSDLRAREARRHLHDVPALLTRPRERAAYARYLSFAEAKQELSAWLGHPQGEERAHALRIWIATVRFDRASLPDALAAVKARKFEQDPVRSAMLEALVDLPLGAFTADHLADVGQILQDALDAADLSQGTAWTAERIVVRLFRRDPAWGAEWLPRLLKVRGSISALGLGDGLTAAEIIALAPGLSTLIQGWMSRERSPAILWLGRSLGRRLPLVPELVTALELCAESAPFAATSALSLDLLARHDRPRFNALVPRLVTADRSFALLARVARFVSHSRQDLLDPLLDGTRVTGRFATGKTPWVLAFDGGYERWNDRQQEAYARGLRAVVSDPARDVPAVLSSLETLARLAFVDPAPFLAFASDPRPPVRERAVRYLPRIDGGEGVPVLVECLGDDRARFAVYALRKAFAEMSPDEVVGVLEKAPMNKVTVAKEVLRLTGELPGEGPFTALLAFDKPTLHRDVRIALLRALWDHLDRPEAWVVFERAAQDPDWVVVSRLADIPVERLSSTAEARLARLLAQVLARPEVEARIELLSRVRSLPLRDEARALFHVCLARMGGPHPDESKVATEAALSRMLASEGSAIVSRMRELASQRRLLLGFVDVLGARVHAQTPEPIRRVGEGLYRLLREDPRLAPLAVRFAPRVLAWKELGELLIDLAVEDLLHVDTMTEALVAASSSPHPDLLEGTLDRASDPRLRRVGLAALCSAAGASVGWTAERRARLERYRLDASPLVAGAAERVFPPE